MLLTLLACAVPTLARAEPDFAIIAASSYSEVPGQKQDSSWLSNIVGALRLDIVNSATLGWLADNRSAPATDADHIGESAHSALLAWSDGREHVWIREQRFMVSERVLFAAEWTETNTQRPAWSKFDLEPGNAEKQLRLSVQIRFGETKR